MELVGDVGTIGHVLVNGCFKIGVFIHDEEAVMTVLEDLMHNHKKLRQEWDDEIQTW